MKLAKSEIGFQFLCNILKIIYKNPDKKIIFADHAHSKKPFDMEETKQILQDWVEFASDVIKENELLVYHQKNVTNKEKMIGWMEQYYGNDLRQKAHNYFFDMKNFFSECGLEKSWKTKFQNIFVKQNGPMPDMLIGISMTLVMGIGYQKNRNIYISWIEVRQILSEAMQILKILNTEFIPDKIFEFEGRSISENLQKIFLVGVYSALRGVYPHKQNQQEENIRFGKNIIEQIILEGKGIELYDSFRQVDEAVQIWKAMWKALEAECEKTILPNGIALYMKDFYEIPLFEPLDQMCSSQILRCDSGYRVRSFVIGKKGSGKTLLAKAAVLSCLKTDSKNSEAYYKFKEKLGGDGENYIPLFIDCTKISEKMDLEKIDLMQIALRQLYEKTRESKYALYIRHWEECEAYLLNYCRENAKNGKLLLILDDFSSFKSSSCQTVSKRLKKIGSEYPKLHILITSQRLVKSLMNQFQNYNRVEITPLSENLEQSIRKLIPLGIGCAEPEFYIDQIQNNRYVSKYIDTPQSLIKYLCYEFEENFDIEELLQETIEEQLESNFESEISDTQCREFLRYLAVNVTENRGRYRKDAESLRERQAIPKNILNKHFFDELKVKLDQPEQVWNHICEKMILICPSDSINSFMFSNRLFYYSLAADYYLELLTKQPETLLKRFNYISAEEFSCIIVMMMKRLCRMYRNFDCFTEEITEYDVFLLVQSVAAYMMSQNDLNDTYQNILALNEILCNEEIQKIFTRAGEETGRTNAWNLLKRTYKECCAYFEERADDTEPLKRIHSVKKVG